MKAAVFYKKEDLRIEDIPVPEISDTEVLVKVHACGICGTDVHIFNGDEGARRRLLRKPFWGTNLRAK